MMNSVQLVPSSNVPARANSTLRYATALSCSDAIDGWQRLRAFTEEVEIPGFSG